MPTCHLCGTACATPECDSCAHVVIAAMRALGEVYRYPADWRCAKEGGAPSIDAYEKIDLATFQPARENLTIDPQGQKYRESGLWPVESGPRFPSGAGLTGCK
jgi:hypothetical protein